jgi:hypothetical protein
MAFNVAELVDDQTRPVRHGTRARSRHVVAFVQPNGERREPLFVSDLVAQMLSLSDGTRTAMEIAIEVGLNHRSEGIPGALRQIEALFVSGLLWLHDGRIDLIGNVTPQPP